MNKDNPIAIVLDNHSLFADSFGKMIEGLGIFEDVRVFTDKVNLIAFLVKLPSQTHSYFFLDYYLEDSTVLPIVNDIKRICRNSFITIVSVATSSSLLRSLVDHTKIDGIISKYSGAEDVIDCINRVMNGEKFVAGYLQRIIDDDMSATKIPLTDRELEIIQYAAQGMTVDITAEKMNISRHTVAAHRRKILSKTGCTSISELLEMARNKKWI